MEPYEIMERLFDKKIVKLLQFFLNNDSSQFYLREISRNTRVSAASTYRILNKLVELKILEINEIKTAKLYSLANNKTVDFIKTILEVDVLQYFIEQAVKMPEINEILLLGKKEKAKANVLVLGENIDKSKMKLLTGEIKEKYDFTVNQMSLSREQYEQMSAMGLYPGNKKVLFRRV